MSLGRVDPGADLSGYYLQAQALQIADNASTKALLSGDFESSTQDYFTATVLQASGERLRSNREIWINTLLNPPKMLVGVSYVPIENQFAKSR